MTISIIHQFLFKLAIAVGLVVALTACGSSSSSSTPTVSSSSAVTSSTNNASNTSSKLASSFSVSSSSQAPDTIPDTFMFSPVTNAVLSTAITSNVVTISGINISVDISISGGLYSLDGGAFTSSSGKVINGQKVVVTVISSASPSSDTRATLTVGGVTGDFSITTEAPDTIPNVFSFPDNITTKLNTAIISSPIIVSGINTATPISVVDAQYSVDGGAYTTLPGTITNGQKVTLQALSAAHISETTQAALTIGGVTSVLKITTVILQGGAIQGASLNLNKTVSTLAGVPHDSDGVDALARFNNPKSVISDGANLYVSDTDNNSIRKIVIASGVVTTLAGGGSGSADGVGTAASFNHPNGIATDGANLYVADTVNNSIRKITIDTGAVTTLAGGSSGNADGVGAAASFSYPMGITTDGTYLYVADMLNHCIRKIVIATGAVTTLVGANDRTNGSSDGVGTAAKFSFPQGVVIDGSNLYVTDTDNNSIRKIVIATGAVTTLAGGKGNGNADGVGIAASFGSPGGITTDGTNLYVTESNNYSIRKIVIANGTVTTLAGGRFGSTDGIGAAATFKNPYGITADGANLYVVDVASNSIRKVVVSTGAVSTLAGKSYGTGDNGIGIAASFWGPKGITTDGINLYVADTANHRIRKIVIATAEVSTLAGFYLGSSNGVGSGADFNYPIGITTDGSYLYVADSKNNSIREIAIATGAVTTLAGGSSGNADGFGAAAGFNYPQGITIDGTSLYVADAKNNSIRKITIATGEVTTLAGGSSGSADGIGAAASFNSPQGIALGGANLYVADTKNNSIRKIVIATGAVTTLAGGSYGVTDGVGATASFKYPVGITTDGASLFVADSEGHSIRKIAIGTGVVTTLVGRGDPGSTDGVGSAASFSSPSGITTDGYSLFVTDTDNNTIRKID